MTYTAVTFAPVQSFIRSSRKLRDLYGSSLLLSHLGRALYNDAIEKLGVDAVISPAEVKSTRGVPNTLLIQGAYSRTDAEKALLRAWSQALLACRSWLENLPHKGTEWEAATWGTDRWEAGWGASWKACELHSWEVFQGQGATIQKAEEALRCAKQRRAWEIPNWTGESSTLSSAEAVVRPRMAEKHDPRLAQSDAHASEARALIRLLRHSGNLGEAFGDENEEISLSELVKRMVTYRQIANTAFGASEGAPLADILPERFERTSVRVASSKKQRPETIVWFMADGDQVGDHLRRLGDSSDQAQGRRAFSSSMRSWAANLYRDVPDHLGPPEKERARLGRQRAELEWGESWPFMRG